MYLKALTLRGFKSFASATTMRLEPGITCIVGPNGSGKSNVVDALTWVMGEQGAKSLRGANMADVIFAGTNGRKALGRAQVELTIDNSDGRLPIDYSEVTISRTLFRGGGSEYAINGVAARLLDVQELLSDTGMGKQMHVIVGQGQLDAVLRATPEERRGYIDEAAGILKHRRRKERALKKLETMDANLVRVLDLTDEIKRQLRPLARQAKAAREAAGTQERIDYATKRLVADDLVTTQTRLERTLEEANRFRSEVAVHDQEIMQIKSQLGDSEESAFSYKLDLQRITELAHQLESVKERLNSLCVLANERLNQAQSKENRVTEAAIELAEEKAEETAEQLKKAEAEVFRQRELVEQAVKEREQIEQTEKDCQQELVAKQAIFASKQKEYNNAREAQVLAASQLESAQMTWRTANQHWEECVQRVQLEKQTAKDLNLVEGLDEVGVSGPEGDNAEAQTAVKTGTGEPSLAMQHAQLVEAEQQARKNLEHVQAVERDVRTETAKWQARRDALAQSLPALRPSDGPGSSLQNSPWKPLGTVDEFIRVARGWETAVTALLHPFEDAPIVLINADIAAGLYEAEMQGNRLRAIVVDQAIRQQDLPVANDLSVEVPVAFSRAVQIASVLEESLGFLIDGAWLAPTVAVAQEMILARQEVKIVATLDGAVLTKTTIRGPGKDGVSTLLIRAQWEDACERTKEQEEKLQEIRLELDRAKRELENTSVKVAEVLSALRAYDAQQAQIAQERARVAARIGAAEEEERRSAQAVEKAKLRTKECQERSEQATSILKEISLPSSEAFLAEPRQAVQDLSEKTKAAREQEIAAKLALRGSEEQQRFATRQADAFRSQARQMRQTLIEQSRREEKLSALRSNLGKILVRAQQAKEQAEIDAGKANDEKRRLGLVLEQFEEATRRLRGQLEGLQWKQSHAGEARQQAEVALAQAGLQYRQSLEKASEIVESEPEIYDETNVRLGREPIANVEKVEETESLNYSEIEPFSEAIEQLIAEYGPEVPIRVPTGDDGKEKLIPYSRSYMSEQLAQAEKELSRLGVVNPLAVEEHAALQARQEFLLEQVGDLRKSKSDLLQIIEDVDARVQQAFEEAFDDVQKQFEHVFAVLFPGGKGQLTLTDPDDPLHTGVEIYARPAGKRVTRLSLLSGGERSLAALAYLVAIFKARPSPFYVMDEVEAALDDINLSRVLQIFEELQEESQLLLVTHQKRTMEIADALYGITMRDGVTSVVSHKMEK